MAIEKIISPITLGVNRTPLPRRRQAEVLSKNLRKKKKKKSVITYADRDSCSGGAAAATSMPALLMLV